MISRRDFFTSIPRVLALTVVGCVSEIYRADPAQAAPNKSSGDYLGTFSASPALTDEVRYASLPGVTIYRFHRDDSDSPFSDITWNDERTHRLDHIEVHTQESNGERAGYVRPWLHWTTR